MKFILFVLYMLGQLIREIIRIPQIVVGETIWLIGVEYRCWYLDVYTKRKKESKA